MLPTLFPAIQAIFLDRDGVINRERKDYVKSWDEFEFLPGALLALEQLSAYSWPILVITNQSAINRNIVSEDEIAEIHRRFTESVSAAGGRIDGIFVCPHRPDEACGCRKPRPGLLTQAAQRFQLNLTQCIFIGDSLTDYQAAVAVNCPAILVHSEYQNAGRWLEGEFQVPILPDLLSAVMTILDSSIEQAKIDQAQVEE